jgi:hypothetical protein
MIGQPALIVREQRLSVGIRTIAPFRGLFGERDILLKELREAMVRSLQLLIRISWRLYLGGMILYLALSLVLYALILPIAQDIARRS